jgi:hypothetical protein
LLLDQFAHLSDPSEAKVQDYYVTQAMYDYRLEDNVDQVMANPADVAHRGRQPRCVVDTRQGGVFGSGPLTPEKAKANPDLKSLKERARLSTLDDCPGLDEANERLLTREAAEVQRDDHAVVPPLLARPGLLIFSPARKQPTCSCSVESSPTPPKAMSVRFAQSAGAQ